MWVSSVNNVFIKAGRLPPGKRENRTLLSPTARRARLIMNRILMYSFLRKIMRMSFENEIICRKIIKMDITNIPKKPMMQHLPELFVIFVC